MSGKISTLILKVDLECCRCYKKIRKILCCLQEKVHITSISYDEKNGTVTVAGVFDPDRLSKKLRCRAGKVIKKIEEKKPEEKIKKEEQKEESKKEENKTEKKEEKKEKEESKKEENKTEKKEEKKEEEKKKQEEEKKKPPKPGIKFEPVVVTPYFWPPGVAICCHQPYVENYLGGCRCCTCGTVTENQTAPAPPASYPPAEPYYYPLPYKTCQFVSEEDPSAYCTVM